MSVSCSIYFLEQDKITCNTILDLKLYDNHCLGYDFVTASDLTRTIDMVRKLEL